jgi:hypothetical protein
VTGADVAAGAAGAAGAEGKIDETGDDTDGNSAGAACSSQVSPQRNVAGVPSLVTVQKQLVSGVASSPGHAP